MWRMGGPTMLQMATVGRPPNSYGYGYALPPYEA